MYSDDIFYELFGKHYSMKYKDCSTQEIIANKEKLEQRLNKMWIKKQIGEYHKELDQIEYIGLKILRNSQGKHKIVASK